MRLQARFRRRVVVVGLLTAGLMLTAAPPLGATGSGSAGEVGSRAAPGPPDVTMADLPADVDWSDINNRGQIVGVTSGAERRVVVWDDGQVTDIGAYEQPSRPDCPLPGWYCPLPGPRAPAINDRGQIGTSMNGRAALWDDGDLVEVGGNLESSWLLSLNARGQALVASITTGRRIIGLWSRGTFTEIASSPLDEPTVWGAQLSDAGHVVMTALGPECMCLDSFLWHRGHRTDLGPFGGLVNRRGQIAGTTTDPTTGEWYPFTWEDGQVTRLPTLGGHQTGVNDINDRGQVVGYGTVPGERGFNTVLWEDGEIVDIGARLDGHNWPVGINERGQVLIRGTGENGRGLAFLWDDGDLVPLPPLDDPWTVVEANGFNDRGQIYGRHYTGTQGPSVPTVWHVHRRQGTP